MQGHIFRKSHNVILNQQFVWSIGRQHDDLTNLPVEITHTSLASHFHGDLLFSFANAGFVDARSKIANRSIATTKFFMCRVGLQKQIDQTFSWPLVIANFFFQIWLTKLDDF